VAEAFFRWLMLAYPPRFRRAHGLALFELFRDEAREVGATQGSRGVLALLVRTVADALRAAPAVWFESTAQPPQHSAVPKLAFGLWHDVRLAARHLRKAPA